MSEVKKSPVPPAELGDRGSVLWVALHQDLEFDTHELQVLLEACRAADLIDRLAAAVEADGVLTTGSTGQKVVHPAVPELRQQQATFARLMGALNLSEALEGTPGAVAAARAISSQAQKAANARWSRSKGARGA